MDRIAISGQNGILFIDPNEIIYGEASNNYTRIVINSGRALVISKTLKDIQEILEVSHFLRIHRQYIINLNCVTHFNRNDSVLTMSNLVMLPVARNQKERLVEKYILL